MKLSGSAEAKRRQRRNDSGGGPEGVRDNVPNKSHSRTQSTLQDMNLQVFSVQAVYAAKNIFERHA